jgi:5'-nucleotidase
MVRPACTVRPQDTEEAGMSRVRLGAALRPRYLALPAATLAALAMVQLGGTANAAPVPAARAAAPALSQHVTTVGFARPALVGPVARAAAPKAVTPPATLKLLAFNDLHGALDPPAGSGGLIQGVPVGGVEYLAGTVKRLRAQYLNTADKVMTVSAGDNIGGSPLTSAAFHDEPTIEELNALGLDLSSVGNHEFDEGVTELKRIQNGGCHPTDGCQDGDPYNGAAFPFLAANVVDKVTRKPVFPAYSINTIRGVKVAFIGETLKGTASIVNPAGISSVDFLDESDTANFYRRKLSAEQGVQAFVLLLHQGGTQSTPAATTDPSACVGFTGDVTPVVSRLDPQFGIVVSGHTHRSYVCSLPNSNGNSLVTSAATNGVLTTDITASLDRVTKGFASVSATNVLVENSTRNPDGTFTRDPSKADPVAVRIANKYRTAIRPIANKVVGSITADITTAPSPAGEEGLGDVIGDAQLLRTASSAGAVAALMNPGGIRTSLIFANSAGGEAPGQITFGEAFAVQPFNNLLVTQTYTGQQLKDALEQQFGGCFGQVASGNILQPSASLTYTYSASAACGSKVSALAINGTAVDPAASYRITTNDFLANGGDQFSRLIAGTDRTTAPGFDVDALTAYLSANSPVPPGPRNRITLVA